MKKDTGPQGLIKKLILHFNIDKTIVMRDSLGFDNTDYMLREILSEMIWGKVEEKNEVLIFKVGHNSLEYDPYNVTDKELITYKSFLEMKYKYIQPEDQPNEALRVEQNKEIRSHRVKHICEIVENGHPGFKFKKQFEDMRRKLRVDEKIQLDLGLKLDNSKLDEKILNEKETPKFNELGEEYTLKDKFRRIFKNSYHKIILSFFNMIIALKKNKQDFGIVFRFFGHDDSDIEEFIFEFNCFCECLHPRFNGDHNNFTKVKFDPVKDKKDHRIHLETEENFGVIYRGIDEKDEIVVFETFSRPELNEMEDLRENIEDFYENENDEINIKLCRGYNEIYLEFMEKIHENCSLVLIDDYSYFKKNNQKHGKLLLVDPYDVDTLQIFFDTGLNANPEKVDVIDVVTKKSLDFRYCRDKFLVNVEPIRAILEPNYFLNRIEECVKNRVNEIRYMEGKELPVMPISQDFNYKDEIKKLNSDKYLEMTVLPLLHNALNLVDMIRPDDPISFVANFMLKNKHTVMNLKHILEKLPSKDSKEIKGPIEDLIQLDEDEEGSVADKQDEMQELRNALDA